MRLRPLLFMKLFEFLDGNKVIHSSVTCALPAVRSQNVCLFRSPSAFWVILKDISLNKLLKINSDENLKDFLDCAEGGGGLCIIQPPAWCQHSCELPLLHCASLPGDSSPSPSTAWLLCSTLSRWETTFHLLCLVYLFAWFFFVCPANIFIKTQQSCHESDEILPSAVATCWSPGARSKPGNHGGQRKKLNAMRSNPASQTRSNHTTCRSDYKRNHCSTTFQHQRRSYDQTGRQNSAPGAKFESKVMTERDLTTLKCEFKMLNSSQIIVGTR